MIMIGAQFRKKCLGPTPFIFYLKIYIMHWSDNQSAQFRKKCLGPTPFIFYLKIYIMNCSDNQSAQFHKKCHEEVEAQIQS